MYNIPMPVSTIRTRMRQEFEKHRFAKKLSVVDVLLMKNNAEYQVRFDDNPSDHVAGSSGEYEGGERGVRMLIWLGL